MADSTNSLLLSVIIVSYNTRDLTLQCLRALCDELEASGLTSQSEIWVVDNASRDESVAAIGAQFPAVKLIQNPRNAGFGAANNLAMAQASGEFFLLLNSDAFVHRGAIATLCKYLQQHPRVAAVGPRLLNGDGTLQVSCWKFPSPKRAWMETLGLAALWARHPFWGDYFRWQHDRARRVEFVIGACLLLRRAIYAQIGGFDEAFFLYAEETDWQRRMSDAAWHIAFTPQAVVTHLGGASGEQSSQLNPHFWNGLDRYVRKHHGKSGLLCLRLAMIVGSLMRAILWGALSLTPPKRAAKAKAKAKLHALLAWRQLTSWKNAA